jgi:hypothetical protein
LLYTNAALVAFLPKGGALLSICTLEHVHHLRRIAMYETPEITKHEDLSQITFSSH